METEASLVFTPTNTDESILLYRMKV